MAHDRTPGSFILETLEPAPVPDAAEQVSVAMRDGVRLALDVYLPRGDGPSALMKASGSGEYQHASLPAAGATPSLFGVSIVTSPAVAAKTAANLRSEVELYEREVPNVVWGTTSATSGAVAASFEKNQIAARGEGRFAVVVPQSEAIAVATLP